MCSASLFSACAIGRIACMDDDVISYTDDVIDYNDDDVMMMSSVCTDCTILMS